MPSDSESNDLFGDESRLQPSDIYHSEEKPCFCGMEVDEIEENDQQLRSKNYYFCFFDTGKSFDVSCLLLNQIKCFFYHQSIFRNPLLLARTHLIPI